MKRILMWSVLIVVTAFALGCSRPPYDAGAIDQSEMDSPQTTKRAPGGGKALKPNEW